MNEAHPPQSRRVRRHITSGPVAGSAWQTAVSAALLAVCYYALARLGLTLSFPPSKTAALWPPVSALMAALLLTPPVRWWAYLLAAFFGHAAVHTHAGTPAAQMVGYCILNMAEAMLPAIALRRLGHAPPRFDTQRDLLLFILWAVVAAPALSATGGVLLGARTPGHLGLEWRIWYLGNLLAHLTVTPVILLWAGRSSTKLPGVPGPRRTEALVLGAGLLAVTFAVMGSDHRVAGVLPAMVYAPLPLLLWAAVRFGPRGAFSALLVTVVITIWHAVHGRGPFAELSPEQNVVNLQVFLIIVGTPLIFLATVIQERRRAAEIVQALAEDVSLAASGEDYFRRLVAQLALTLDASHALVGEWDPTAPTRIRTVAVWSDGRQAPNFCYELADTPCENVIGKKVCLYARQVREQFPHDHLLQELSVESYAGTPLVDRMGRVVGILVVLDTQRMTRPEFTGWLLQIFAGRAATELERMHAEAALRASEERFRRVVHDLTELVCRNRADGTLTFANEAYCRYFNKRPEDLIGRTFLPAVPADDHEMIRAHFSSFTHEQPVATIVHRVLTPTGEVRWHEWTNRAIFDEQGRIVEYQGVGRDITAHRLAEEERTRLEGQLRQAHKLEAIGRLAGGVAHDFNNLLTVVLGNAEAAMEILGGREAHPCLVQALEEIQQAGTRGASLTKQLLTFSRRQIQQPQVVSPLQVINGFEGMLRRLIGEHIQIQIHAAASTLRIRIDAGQLELAVMNLAINARDAMPDGGVLSIEIRDEVLDDLYAASHLDARPGPHVLIAVGDTGEGMNEETLIHLFEPFFTTKPVGKGTGLGLATVYGIVRQAEGHITVESRLGQGSTFGLHLPAVDEPETEPPPPVEHAPPGGSETILLCEDEAMVRRMVSAALRSRGYTIIEAEDGERAMGAAQRHAGPIHLLLTDLVMPRLNGRALASKLAQERPGIRVLYMSGYTSDVVDEQGVLTDPLTFLQKPFQIHELLQHVRDALDHH